MAFGILFSSQEPEPAEPPKPVRARAKKGQFKADDPSTPDTNEAWETAAGSAEPVVETSYAG